MPLCKLCGNNLPLVRAHIIPEAFHRDMRGDAAPPVMLSNNPSQFPRRRPGGHYDESLVCEPCERRFQDWDNYAADFFLRQMRDGGVRLYDKATVYTPVDYPNLKLFAISLLWRAGASDIDFCARVTLGRYEAYARDHILRADPGAPDEFAVMLTRWVTQPKYDEFAKVQFSPYRTRMRGVRLVKFFFAGVVLHVKTDRQPYPDPLRELMLRPGVELCVIDRELEGSGDINAMRQALASFADHRGRE